MGTNRAEQGILVIFAIRSLIAVGLLVLAVLAGRALWKYIHTKTASNSVPEEMPGENKVSKTLPDAIQENRKRCGLTQEQLAQRLNVSRQAVSKWENGTAEPSTANLLTLAEVFGITVDSLLQATQE